VSILNTIIKPDIHDIEKSSSPTEDTPCLHYSDQSLNVLRDIIAFFRITRTLWEQIWKALILKQVTHVMTTGL